MYKKKKSGIIGIVVTVIILILLIGISIQNIKLIIPSILVFILVAAYTYLANNKRKNEIML